ncbi:MAG TPA: efflux RND transporter periplasmic adaptor subunit, partial [Steroidobacteraceae bacterium]|nr:efflux RND transporter periplasmic adaptor subunit [Steroidobacteraceae bacterium]
QTTTSDSRRSRRLLAWGAVLLLLLCAALGIWWWLAHRQTLRYITARVTAGDIQRSVTMTGALNPVVTAQVESFVSGNIKAWYCDYNTLVKIGQVCALIDPLPFQVIVDQDTASLHSAMAQLAKDEVAAANQAVVYDFDQKLIKQGIVSQETINTDKATLDQERSQVNLDKATIAAQKAALHGAEVNLGYTRILSPVNGMVITRYIDVGQTVVSSLSASPLFLIGKDMHFMQVDTNVSEADVGGVKPGQRAYFTVQAYPSRTFWGTVRQIREGPITVQNVVTYDVVIDVKNEDLALFPGMTADSHIITAERRNVMRVPLPAIRFNPEGIAHEGSRQRGSAAGGAPAANRFAGGGEHAGAEHGGVRAGRSGLRGRVWVMRAGKLLAVRVRIGLDDGTLVEVAGDDLHVGDTVVVNAARPNETRTAPAGNRPGAGQNPRGGGFGGGFRL